MANRQKQKGDRAEMAVRDYLKTIWPDTFRTRPGFTDDLGDVIAETPAGRLVVQVKDVATPQWKTWWEQLADQITTCKRESDRPVIGGIIVHKARGKGNPAEWRAVSTLGDFTTMLTQLTQEAE